MPESPLSNRYPAAFIGRGLFPIYIQLATIFRRLIENGEWAVGRQVPTHEQLGLQFGVNTTTVRKAVELLVREGLLKAYRKRGTFVITKPARQEWYDIPTSLHAALDTPGDIEIETRRASMPRQLPFSSGSSKSDAASYRLLRRIHRRRGQPICIENCFLRLDLMQGSKLARLKRSSLALVHDVQPNEIAHANATLTFGIADKEAARQLKISLNAPIAIFHQRATGTRGAILMDSTSYFRGDCVRVFERIKP
jgi:GntR family transcriptional regulator